ncbi:hypothetical protein LX32DRAFT_58403 [Colletotrichum zoysiae]|uniref:Uncharacterized protein n=1 Tax=Colletotrichum zoysiae TaxID=1216348 RepID=A0AAD9M526_9PEZI|nr:hypothetical protein LX32DRAFT_58403 [Colletotrichum zoysiae]
MIPGSVPWYHDSCLTFLTSWWQGKRTQPNITSHSDITTRRFLALGEAATPWNSLLVCGRRRTFLRFPRIVVDILLCSQQSGEYSNILHRRSHCLTAVARKPSFFWLGTIGPGLRNLQILTSLPCRCVRHALVQRDLVEPPPTQHPTATPPPTCFRSKTRRFSKQFRAETAVGASSSVCLLLPFYAMLSCSSSSLSPASPSVALNRGYPRTETTKRKRRWETERHVRPVSSQIRRLPRG